MNKLLYLSLCALLLNSCIITDEIEAEVLDTTDSGLELFINFDSQTATDISGNGYNGLVGGSRFVTNTPSGSGYAYSIVEASELITIPYNPFIGLTEYSICFWLRDPSQGLLMNTYGNNTNSNTANYPTIRISDNLFYSAFNSYAMSDYFNYNPSTVLQDGDWHYVVITASSELQSLYVDNSKVATQLESVNTSASSEIHFGGVLYEYAGASMKIDNIRIYSRALTSQEISLIYNEER